MYRSLGTAQVVARRPSPRVLVAKYVPIRSFSFSLAVDLFLLVSLKAKQRNKADYDTIRRNVERVPFCVR